MRYLADILTLIRFILAITLFALCFISGTPGVVLIIFLLGELTDAFDGTAATRWPFPKDKAPKYRKYAAKYDMFTDILLASGMALYFIMRVNLVAGLVIGVGFSLAAIIIDLIVYGRVLGHPDDFTKNSLSARNFPLAKKIILLRRRLYLVLMAIVSVWTLLVTAWPLPVKIATFTIAAIVCVFLWFFLAQRRHHISRDAEKLENNLESHAQNRKSPKR